MLRIFTLAALLASAAPAALAQTAAATSSAQGVISYPQAFFAEQRPVTAYDMVGRLPGFTLDTGDNVRGFEGAAGNVLIDGGRPTSKTDTLDDILRRIPASQVDHIQLIRGGAPGVDMQGKSILANVVKVKGGKLQGLVQVGQALGYDGRYKFGVRVEGSGPAGPGAWEGSLRYGEGIDDGAGEGPHLVLNPAGVVVERSDIDSHGAVHQWIGSGAYETPAFGGKLRVNGRIFDDNYRYNELNWLKFPVTGLESSNDRQDRFQTEVGANFKRELGARKNLELLLLHQTEDYSYDSRFRSTPTDFDFKLGKDISETIGRGVFKFRQSETLSWEAGAEAALNKLESKTAFSQDGVAIPLPASNVTVEEKRGEIFVKAVWRPTKTWTVEGSVREEGSAISSDGDVSLEKTLYYTKPRVAATWAPSANTQVRLRFERVVGQLDFDDFVATSSLGTGVITAGNPDLVPEQAWVSEAAIEQRFWTKGAAVLTLRHFALTDAIDRAPVFGPSGAFDAPSNIGDGTKDELQVTLTLPLDRFIPGAQLRGDSTWRRSEVTDPTTGAKREISGLRPLDWEAHFSQDLPQWRATWGVDAFGAWRETYYRFDEISTDKLKTYVTLFAEWKPKPDLLVRAEIQNATARGFRHTRQLYSGPRGANPLTAIDDRDIQVGRVFYVRVRKSFG
ncbi:TonB-dependent siderophore receptor [Phenylobacterium sp.]|uniref:TonB-dependent receptor plug domain-containing protein n=1 Tax=Phenylobacterium sp. TaxID=1871053 RepID=UPI0027378B21|nr:TonB-dependent receptor [Phenylobacterium sp.]MDP3869990.1 TonB-dependent receptor [Phenylobacterium sp.]